MANVHRIRRQRWQVRASDLPSALQLRGALRNELETRVLPLFERAFDRLADEHTHLHIPRLTLSLRVGSLDELWSQLPALVAEQVAAQCAREPTLQSPAPTSSPARVVEPEQHANGALAEYLTTGALPWQLATAPAAEVASLLRNAASRLVKRWLQQRALPSAELPSSLPEATAYFFRLLQLVPAELFSELSALALPPPAQGRVGDDSRKEALRAAPEQPAPDAPLRQRAAFLAEQLVSRVRFSEPTAANSLRSLAQPASEPEVAAAGRDRPDAAFERRPGKPPDESAPPAAARQPVPEKSESTIASPPTREAARARRPSEPSQRDDASAFLPIPSAPEPATADAPGFRTWVPAAGLVLLHPFLPQLFSGLGIVAEAPTALRRSELGRAAALLHWLAWGSREAHEYEAGFIKLLLGLEPGQALGLDMAELGPDDEREASALLQAAIDHFRALKSTSIEGLRQAFLQRSGLLSRADLGWHVHLEAAAFDVLLAQLPWGVGVVKLPWMPTPLFTEWPSA